MAIYALLMFFTVVLVLLAGYPVALTLAGTALLFALGGVIGGGFEIAFIETMPSRLFGIMNTKHSLRCRCLSSWE